MAWTVDEKRNIRLGVAIEVIIAFVLLYLVVESSILSIRIGSGAALVTLGAFIYYLRKKTKLDSYKHKSIKELKFWIAYLPVVVAFISAVGVTEYLENAEEEEYLNNRLQVVNIFSSATEVANAMMLENSPDYTLLNKGKRAERYLSMETIEIMDQVYRAHTVARQYSRRLLPIGVESCVYKVGEGLFNMGTTIQDYLETPSMSLKETFLIQYKNAALQNSKCESLIKGYLKVYEEKALAEQEAARKEQDALLQKSIADQIKTTPDASKANSVACETLTFFKGLGANAFYSPYTPGAAPGLSPAQKAIKNIISNSDVGNARLPSWVKDWLQNPSVDPAGKPISNCALYNGQEWYFLNVFKPHDAPGGNGNLFVNLTTGQANIRIYKDEPLKTNGQLDGSFHHRLVFTSNSDSYWEQIEEEFAPLTDSN